MKARDAGALEAAVRARRGTLHAPFFAPSLAALGNALLRRRPTTSAASTPSRRAHALSLAYFHLRDAHAGKGLWPRTPSRRLGDCALRWSWTKLKIQRVARARRFGWGPEPGFHSSGSRRKLLRRPWRCPRRNSGVYSPRIARRFYAALRICGVVSLGELIDEETLHAAATLETEVRSSFEAGQGGKGLASAALSDPRVRGRGQNRFEVELPALALNASVVAHPVLHPLIGLVFDTGRASARTRSPRSWLPRRGPADHHADTSEICACRRQANYSICRLTG